MTQVTVPLSGNLWTASAAVLKKLQSPLQAKQKRLMELLAPEAALIETLAVTPETLVQKRHPLPESMQAVMMEVKQALSQLDDRYQHFVQRYVDPLLIDRSRSTQLALLAAGRARQTSEAEKSINRHILIGMGAVATVGLAQVTALPLVPLVVATGFYLTIPLFRLCWQIGFKERRLSVAHLLAAYFVGMWLGGYYTIGAIGMILLGMAQKVMVLCEQSLHDNMVTIFGEQPHQVWVVVDGVETEIAFAALRVGDILVLDIGQMAPIDGVVVQGMATLDQHMLTGEAQPVEKGVGDTVLAATVVLSGRLYVRVEKTGGETTAAKIGEVLNRNDEYRVATEQKAIAIAEKSLWPMVVAGAVALPLVGPSSALAILGSNFTMNMVALRPLTVLNFFNTASKQGILIKDAEALERIKTLTTIVFDKTGTLTLEQPQVVAIHPYHGYTAEHVLTLAAAAEHRQTHPIAQAILAAAATRGLTIPAVEGAAYAVGYGLHVQVAGQPVRVGSLRFMQSEGIALPAELAALQTTVEELGHSLVFVAVADTLAGAIQLQATIRPEAKAVVAQLQAQGFTLYIISGDHDAPTRQLATELGIPHYFAGVLPEDKAALVCKLQADGHKVCFVGDGINDTIALRKADVSVSLRGATTAATDTAQVVLMNADLRQLQRLLHLAHELEQNIALNFGVATAFSLLSGGSILFLHFKFAAVEVLAATQLLTGVGIASKSLLSAALTVPNDKSELD